VNIDLVAHDAVDSYRWIYNNYKGMNGNLSLEEVKLSPHYTNFTTKVRYMYEAMGDTFDVSVAYPWELYLFTGMNEQQIRIMVNEALEWQKTQPIEKVKWTSPASLPGKAGVVSVSWKNGLRLMPEMQDIFMAFREAGIDIWICTASFVDVIKEISSNPIYGYNNPDDRVIGMELERDSNGIVKTEFRHGYMQTQQKGKTRAIERFIVSKYGYGPSFVAGDSEGDMNMMQDFANTKLVLIINRLKGKDIAKLSKQAVLSYGKPNAKILLQGRNDNTGEFVKSQAHIKFGATEGQVLRE
jgi:phosphoserine phosphatase